MGLTAWIIDDDMVSQFATEYCVRQSHNQIEIKRYDNATEGLENLIDCLKTAKGIPEIILLDLVMSVMDGWTFLDEVEKLGDFKNKINVFVVSSFAISKDRERAKNHPLIQGYFDKPVTKVSVDKILQSVRQ